MLKEWLKNIGLPYVNLYHNLFMDENGQLIKSAEYRWTAFAARGLYFMGRLS